jgi:hypothetical protein
MVVVRESEWSRRERILREMEEAKSEETANSEETNSEVTVQVILQ